MLLVIGLLVIIIISAGIAFSFYIKDEEIINPVAESCTEGQKSTWSNCSCSKICVDEDDIFNRVDCARVCPKNSD